MLCRHSNPQFDSTLSKKEEKKFIVVTSKKMVDSPILLQSNNFLERTLAIIKPDAVAKTNEIEDIIMRAGFTILQRRRVHLTLEQASDFYSEHFGKKIFASLVEFMSSGPIICLLLARSHAINIWDELIGPPNTYKAQQICPESIRALYGHDELQNAVHGSENQICAEREIRFFFPESILDPIQTNQLVKDYLAKTVNPTLLKGLTQLSKVKPSDPVGWLAEWLQNNNPYKPRIQLSEGPSNVA